MTDLYFNEHDPYAAAWLRNLYPEATVDDRDIRQVQPADVMGHSRCHWFGGIGGWQLALDLVGWGDRPVWSGSCPCQPFSAAGEKKGTADDRHLWPEMFRLIRECRPAIAVGEQVASRLGREWLNGVRLDLEALGYAVGAADLCAASLGAPHIRQRLFWVAVAGSAGVRDSRPRADAGATCGAEGFGQERQWVRSDPGNGGGSPDRLGHANGTGHAGRQGERGDDGPQRQAAERAGNDAGGVDNSTGQRTGDREQAESGSNGTDHGISRQAGSWSDYRLIPCRDGKVRRVSAESSDGPLAAKLPRAVGPELAGLGGLGALASRDELREARASLKRAKANRTGRLRGYGNSIVPQVAAVFLRAVMEVLAK